MTNTTPPTTQVVHLDFIALSDTTDEAAIEDLIREAAGLKALESVRTVGVIRGERNQYRGLKPSASEASAMPGVSTPGTANATSFDLAFFFVLDGFTDLEPFGTNPQYTRFLQGKVARVLRGFAGADVALTAPFPEAGDYAACLALMAPEETYDWEVREALEGWAGESTAAVGLAIGERQRYRGCVLRFTSDDQTPAALADRRFEATLIAGSAARL